MGEVIRFWFRGDVVEIADVPATTTVLQWLRATRRSLGTKEGCAEGDCGACTVVLGRLDSDGRLVTEPAHACLLLIPMLHGRALLTIEDIADGAHLHPVQESLVGSHGSQCGFCTPGIVMSLWQLHADADGRELTPDEVRTSLAGHACRCTGYRSIVEGAIAASGRSAREVDRAAVQSQLGQIGAADALDYRHAGTHWRAPVSVDALLAARAETQGAILMSGGTDLVPAGPGRGELPDEWLSALAVPELAVIEEREGVLRIGGAASIEAAWQALAARWPQLDTGRRRFASPPVRRQATIGGNLATASPVGDTAPVLLAVGAQVVLASIRGERCVPMDEFVTGYRRTALAADEVLVRVDIPSDVKGWDVRMWKVARRFDNDIAAVSLATALALDTSGSVRGVRVAFGGTAAVPTRARAVEGALLGRSWDASAAAAAQDAVAVDVSPVSDHRGSAEYRLAAARGLLQRWWLQTRAEDPLPVGETEVWRAQP